MKKHVMLGSQGQGQRCQFFSKLLFQFNVIPIRIIEYICIHTYIHTYIYIYVCMYTHIFFFLLDKTALKYIWKTKQETAQTEKRDDLHCQI